MTTPIDILIRAIWQGGRATQQAKKDLEGIDSGSRKGSRGLEDFARKATAAGLALGAVTLAAKNAYATLERGAGLELTRQRFDRLAESIGTTGDQLRQNLAVSTAGLLSTSQQMALATDLVGLELANTEDQAVRLARVVAELDQDVGELSLALVNQTTRRFDQLNVSAVGFEKRLEALEAQGLSTQDAFTEAFLQQAEAQIERVGGVAGTSAGDLRQFNAAIQEIKDSSALAAVSVVEFSNGFETLENTAATLNQVSAAVQRLGDILDDINLGGGFQTGLSDPVGALVNRLFPIRPFGIDKIIRDAITGTEDYQDAVDGLGEALQGLAAFFGLAESANKELLEGMTKTTGAIQDQISALNKLTAAGPDRTGTGRNPDIEEFREDRLSARVSLFVQFQDDLTAVTEQGQIDRAAIEEQYESQRTATIESYNRQRAQEEEDWLRRRSQQDRELRRNIDEVRESAAESEQDARGRTNDQLAKLERDHLRRMQEIIENADLARKDAASRLDAQAIGSIDRQEEAAKRKELQNFADQRQEIQNALQEQLSDIRENMAERIADLQEFHDERQQQEEEDREIRLKRLEEEHRRELQEIDSQYDTRMRELKESIRREQDEITRRYKEDRLALADHWQQKLDQDAAYQERILDQEEAWWQQRLAIVGGSDRGESGAGGGTAGGGGTGPGGEGEQPTKDELLQLAKALAIQSGYSEARADALVRSLQFYTAKAIADWIERVFEYDVPGYEMGTPFVPRTGTYKLHVGEGVLTAAENREYQQRRQLPNVSINIYPTPGMDEGMVARLARRELEVFFEEVS